MTSEIFWLEVTRRSFLRGRSFQSLTWGLKNFKYMSSLAFRLRNMIRMFEKLRETSILWNLKAILIKMQDSQHRTLLKSPRIYQSTVSSTRPLRLSRAHSPLEKNRSSRFEKKIFKRGHDEGTHLNQPQAICYRPSSSTLQSRNIYIKERNWKINTHRDSYVVSNVM